MNIATPSATEIPIAKAKKRRSKKRKAVNRSERVAATPETLAKLQRDEIQEMLLRNDGIDEQEVEALLKIEEAWRVIQDEVSALGGWAPERVGGGDHEMSNRAARLWTIWNVWATEFQRQTTIKGAQIALWVTERRSLPEGSAAILKRAARLWDRFEDDHDRRERELRDQVQDAVA